ncbi:MAG: GNAT family N-acetyltransferase [Gaiellaceae bacterium]
MNVRRATRADVPELARVHTESARAAYAGIAPLEEDGLARRTANWLSVFDDAVGSPHVAEVDGHVIGILNFGPAREQVEVGELYVLYVLPYYWGSGAAQLLIDTAHRGLSHAHREAVLSVLADNPRARRFYERNRWQLDEVRVEPHFGGVPTEIARYRKALSAAGADRNASNLV